MADYKSKIKDLHSNTDILIFFIDSNFKKENLIFNNQTNQLEMDTLQLDEIERLKNYLISKKTQCDVLDIALAQTEKQILNERLKVVIIYLDRK